MEVHVFLQAHAHAALDTDAPELADKIVDLGEEAEAAALGECLTVLVDAIDERLVVFAARPALGCWALREGGRWSRVACAVPLVSTEKPRPVARSWSTN